MFLFFVVINSYQRSDKQAFFTSERSNLPARTLATICNNIFEARLPN